MVNVTNTAITTRFLYTTVQCIVMFSNYSSLNLNRYCLWSGFLLVYPIPGSQFWNSNSHSVKKKRKIFCRSPLCIVDTRNFEHFTFQCWYSFNTEDRIQSVQSRLFDFIVKLPSESISFFKFSFLSYRCVESMLW
jgi:hypothetical protein